MITNRSVAGRIHPDGGYAIVRHLEAVLGFVEVSEGSRSSPRESMMSRQNQWTIKIMDHLQIRLLSFKY